MGTKKSKDKNQSYGHHLATGSLGNFITLLRQNKGFDKKYLLRVLNIFVSNLFLMPFQKFESIKWDKKIENIQITQPPIFIIGHLRTGTTYLHHLMSFDESLGYISTLQAFCPRICIEGSRILGPIFKALLPAKRPMDNMLMDLHFPQEEEYAFANLSPLSFYVSYSFPHSMNSIYKMLLFENKDDQLRQKWQDLFMSILKKATLIMNGKRLVIKNPFHTLHIPVILEIFPDAQFIHLDRNPYIIYYSTLKTFTTLINKFQLEDISKSEIEENVFRIYDGMMRKYWDTKNLIPAGNLTEVLFEDFEINTLHVLERIYNELCIPLSEQTRSNFESYIASQVHYQKNVYTLDKDTLDKVYEHWHFVIDTLGYQPPTLS